MEFVKNNVKLIDLAEPGKKIEYAGRVCYKSQDKISDDSYERFIKGIVNRGHCYDEETEVLTSNGFKFWKDLTKDDFVGMVEPKTRKFIGFSKPLKMISYDVDEDLISFENRDVSLLITDGHKIYASFCNTEYNRNHPEGNFSLIEAKTPNVSKRQHPTKPAWQKPLRMSSAAKNDQKGIEYTPEMFKFFGFFIGDGCATPKNKKVSFHLKKPRKIEWLKETLAECNLDYSITENKDETFTFIISIDREKLFSLFYNENNKKTFPVEFLKMSREQFSNFYEGLVNSDGSIYDGQMRYGTNSKELVERLQALFSINDMVVGNINEKNGNYSFNIFENNFPMFNDSRKKGTTIKKHYTGKVYCCEVETGLLIIRRNNKVCLCGNCSVLEHERKMFAIPADVFCENNYEDIFEFQHYFNITVNKKGEPSYFFVSGNIRAWYELLHGPAFIMFPEETKVLKNFLYKDYPYLFEVDENEDVRDDNILYDLDAEKICDDLSKHKAYTFEIVGSRSFTHQLVRHRTLSFSQESQRYCNYSGNKFNHSVKFIKCDAFEDDILQTIEDAYFKAIDNGAKPEDARQILPNCTASTIVVTGTLDDWRKFLYLRLDQHAQKEIREIAETILSYLPLTRKNVGYV